MDIGAQTIFNAQTIPQSSRKQKLAWVAAFAAMTGERKARPHPNPLPSFATMTTERETTNLSSPLHTIPPTPLPTHANAGHKPRALKRFIPARFSRTGSHPLEGVAMHNIHCPLDRPSARAGGQTPISSSIAPTRANGRGASCRRQANKTRPAVNTARPRRWPAPYGAD